MKFILRILTCMALYAVSAVALKLAAPELPYWHQLLISMSAFGAGTLWGIKP